MTDILQKNALSYTQKNPKDDGENIDAFLAYIGKNIKKFRIRAGFTQAQLAQKADISRITLVRAEQGKANITLNTLWMLAKSCKVSPDAILNNEDTIHISKADIMQEGWQHIKQRITNG